MDEPLLLGEWGSERKSVEVQRFLSASLTLSLCGGRCYVHVVVRAGFPSRRTEGSVLEFHGKIELAG